MKRFVLLQPCLASLCMIGAAPVALADSRADLSGTWSEFDDLADRAPQQTASDHVLVIEQTEATLTITESFGDTLEWRYEFRWDGGESTNERRTAAGTVWLETSTAEWVEGAFVVKTRHTTPNGSFDTLEMYFLDVHGRLNIASLGSDIRDANLMGLQAVIYERRS